MTNSRLTTGTTTTGIALRVERDGNHARIVHAATGNTAVDEHGPLIYDRGPGSWTCAREALGLIVADAPADVTVLPDANTPEQATRPVPATEPVPFITADPEPQGYAIPSPEETAAHRAAQAETVRADEVTTSDVLLQGRALTIRRPVTTIESMDDGLVLIRYGTGFSTRRADAPVTIERRAGQSATAPVLESTAKARVLANLDRVEAAKLAATRPDLFELTPVTTEVIRAVLAGEPAREVAAARSRGYVRWDADLGRRVVTPMGQVAYERRTPAPEPTPATRQADYLFAIATHLRAHPHLAPVNPHYGGSELQISTPYRDPRTEAQALAEWADTLTDAHLTAKRYDADISKGKPKDVKVTLAGSIAGLDIEAWDVVDAATEFGLQPGQERDITVENLITLVGANWVQR